MNRYAFGYLVWFGGIAFGGGPCCFALMQVLCWGTPPNVQSLLTCHELSTAAVDLAKPPRAPTEMSHNCQQKRSNQQRRITGVECPRLLGRLRQKTEQVQQRHSYALIKPLPCH